MEDMEINGEEYIGVNEKPKENAQAVTAIKVKRGAPKFDRDRVIKIVMVSLGVLVVAGVIITNISKKREDEAVETRVAGNINVPEEFRRRSLAAAYNEESREGTAEEIIAEVETETETDIEAEVYGYLPAYGQVKSATGNVASVPPRPDTQPVPRSGSGGNDRESLGTSGGAAATAPDPAINAKLIPHVEGNGSVYSGAATAAPQGGGQAVDLTQILRGLQNTTYPTPVQYVPPQPYGQQAAPYGQQAGTASEISQQSYQAQNMQNDKQEFYDTGGGATGGGVIKNGYYIGEDTLWNGTIIPAVLVTGINTDLPGEVMARVSQNIYDSLTGKHLLIPQGTILMARYNSSVSYAQGRVQIIWNTLTRPDGYQIELGGMNGVDDRGMSGYQGEYHENWFQYLKAAGIITMFTLANGEMTRAAGGAAANTDVAAANQNIVNQLAGNITARALNIQPTITVKSGEKINVMLNKAVYLPPVEGYKPVERYRR
jgi:type IV secretory pathway VirB10-like protein